MAERQAGRWGRRVRRGLVAVMLLLVIAGIVIYWRYLTPAALERMAGRIVAERTGCELNMDSARFLWLKGVRFEGIVLVEPDSEDPAVLADRLQITPRWRSLLKGRVEPDVVQANGVSVAARLDAEGRWTLFRRTGGEKPSGPPGRWPHLIVKDARIRILPAVPTGPVPPLDLRGLDLEITPMGPARTLSVTAFLTRAEFGGWRVEAWLNPATKSAEGAVVVQGLEIGPHLRPWVPANHRASWDRLAPSGLANLDAYFQYNAAAKPPLHVEGNISIRQGVFQHPRLPFPLAGIESSATFNDLTMNIASFSARFGEAEIDGKGKVSRLANGRIAYDADLNARNIVLEDALIQTLPDRIREGWKRLDPTGRLAAEAIVRSGTAGHPDFRAEVEFQDVTLRPRELLWPVKDLRGKLYIRPESISMQDVARGEWAGGRVEFLGAADLKAGVTTGSATLKGLDIERPLADLIPSSVQEKIPRQLLDLWVRDGIAAVKADARITLALEPDQPPRYEIVAQVPWLRYANPRLREPVILSTIARVTPDGFHIGKSTARWAAAIAEVEPAVFPFDPRQSWYASFEVRDVALTSELKEQLPPGMRRAWDTFHEPTGTLDLRGMVWKEAGDDSALHNHVVTTMRSGAAAFDGFPYPLRELNGHWEVEDGYLSNAFFHARNGETDVEIAVQKAPYQGLPGRRYVIRGRNARFDRDLYDALPPVYRELYKPEQLDGKFDLDLLIHFVRPTQDMPGWNHFEALVVIPELVLKNDIPMQMRDGKIAVEDASIIKDAVTLEGRAQARELTIEKVRLDNAEIGFESSEDEISLKRIVSGCYGGNLSGSLRITARDEWRGGRPFVGSFYLSDADFGAITLDRQQKETQGVLNATSNFGGLTGPQRDFRAVGAMALRDANIQSLPGFLSPLNLLVLRNPLRKPSFDALEMEYEFQKDVFMAKEINLLGSLISLEGRGTVNKEGTVDFRFIPVFGPRLPSIPGLDQFLTILKQPLTITATGDYNDPVIQLNPILSLTQVVQRTLFGLIPPDVLQKQEKPNDG